eukprot:TRINITY_DN48204_c0_g1_i1.p1 TRINITY_DN48204_c0_g1~~TRINITY_DN48204_c0_g1_i1.p1  ORF type:complete len:474 (-),score=104.89 TRINITY_DN48204_c0_g1_i1:82-1503(-)
MPSELLNALFKRRSDVDSGGQTWESNPEESSADAAASHLAGLTFDAPSAQEWLNQLEPSPEEDLLADALTDDLAARQKSAPSHVPRAVKPEDAERLKQLVNELGSLQQQFSQERESLGAAREELKARQAEIAKREAEVEAEKEAQRCREEARRNYPQPDWLDNVDGCINIAVVGNSGVGKSLLINRLRRLRPQAQGWAPVGVNETTMRPTMYPFPNQPGVRLWDLPGAGTVSVPAETYLQDMGLRYFDQVLVVTAGRFTEMEGTLRSELQRYDVPYCMVRSKVDQDIVNNREDNFTDKQQTLRQIREDLEKNHSVDTHRLYLISSRDPEEYDMPRLLAELFPGLKRELDPSAPAFHPAGTAQAMAAGQVHMTPAAWNDAWAMPIALSLILSGLQGRWRDGYNAFYLIQNDQCHVSLQNGSHALVHFAQDETHVWWCSRWYVDEEAMLRARRFRELRWAPANLQDKPLVWWYCD